MRFTDGQMRQDGELIERMWFLVFGEAAPRRRTAPSPKIIPAV
ncbi:hypothetical protein FRACA_170046 [Frankia canadensis]|uniref:Uncharacterized protein n=1 Tax=Frankia canadensis TaxID=1836972 RepID=A0A2I2KN52_9ACTN|nr:hypothetical protein [Frankia canadensis]SNQ47086.1 hypothetical protein FRACA_170046 [Frankia canadensis]SOU54376.1 hypothetical protein FRACA_170046 [Frankia canadensis]